MTRQSAIRPISAPSAIWNSGRGNGTGTMRATIPLMTTATISIRTIVTLSKMGSLLASPLRARSRTRQDEQVGKNHVSDMQPSALDVGEEGAHRYCAQHAEGDLGATEQRDGPDRAMRGHEQYDGGRNTGKPRGRT